MATGARFLGRVGASLVLLIAVVSCGASSQDPSADSAPAISPGDETAAVVPPHIRIEYGSEPDQFGRLQLPAGSAPNDGFPVVVLIHGGFWRDMFFLDLMDNVAEDLAERGYASWNIEYRRVQGAGGWPETGDDVVTAIDSLADMRADQPIDLDRVVSLGHSAGAHLGLWALGEQNRVHVRGSIGMGAVVDLAYFSQTVALLGGTIDEVHEVYADAAPVLDPERVVLVQGSEDNVVSSASLQVAEDAGVPIVTIDGDNHFDLIRPATDSWVAALEAIEMFVGPAK